MTKITNTLEFFIVDIGPHMFQESHNASQNSTINDHNDHYDQRTQQLTIIHLLYPNPNITHIDPISNTNPNILIKP